MIDIALQSLLATASGVKVYPSTETEPVTANLPKVLYTLIDLPNDYTDDGSTGLRKARYQLDIFAEKMTAARNIADDIRISLDDWRGTVAADNNATKIERISFDTERFQKGESVAGQNKTIARYIQDVIVDYRERVS